MSCVIFEMGFRCPMLVDDYYMQNDLIFPLCPRCNTILEYSYQNYCHGCGQRLNWALYSEWVHDEEGHYF